MKKEQKEVPKRKIKLIGILVILLILYLFGFFFYRILLTPIKNIYISNNQYLEDQEIIDQARINNYPSFFLTTKSSIKRKLLKNKMIKSVEINKKLFGKIYINITENTPLFYDLTSRKTILDNKEELSNVSYIVPVLTNKLDKDIYNNLIEKMSKVQSNILIMISEIKHVPTTVDEERFLMIMNDGNYVYITLTKITYLNEYIKILPTLDGKKGMLYLDSGNYFEIFK